MCKQTLTWARNDEQLTALVALREKPEGKPMDYNWAIIILDAVQVLWRQGNPGEDLCYWIHYGQVFFTDAHVPIQPTQIQLSKGDKKFSAYNVWATVAD